MDISSDGRTNTEIKSTIAMAKETFDKRKELGTKGLNISLKK